MIAGARNGNLQLLTFARFPEPEFLVDEEQHFGRLSGGVRRLIYLRRCSWDTHHEEKYDCDEERFSFHAMKLQCLKIGWACQALARETPRLPESHPTIETCGGAELRFYAEEQVVPGDAVGAAQRARPGTIVIGRGTSAKAGTSLRLRGKAMRQPRASGLELPRESPCTPSPISRQKYQPCRVRSRCDPRFRPEFPRRSRRGPRTCTQGRGRYSKELLP